MFENLRHHLETVFDSLKATRQEEVDKVRVDNPEFLPAALELLDTPPNPLGRLILWIILSFLGLALIWSIFGSVDIVATGEGKLIPRGQVKVIQTADGGVVRALQVVDGQFVHKGDILVDLDPTAASAEFEQARQALLTAEIELARSRVLADYAAGRNSGFVAPPGADPTIVAVQQAYLREKISQQSATMQGLENDRRQRSQEAAMVRQEIVKIQQQLPIFTKQLASLQKLEAQGYAASTKVDELREKVIEMQQDLQIRTAEVQKSEAAEISAQTAISTQRAKFANESFDSLTQAEATYRLREEELKKAAEKQKQTALTAPVDGTVQQLAVHTVGGVVKAADALMVIVPREAELVVEAQIPGRDIGFIHEGQPVELKFEAFPFTRYGTAHGVMEQLNPDATMDEKKGLLYTAVIKINEADRLATDLRKVGQLDVSKLKPGMAATVEVKTGRRSIISFLLSPLTRRVQEAARER